MILYNLRVSDRRDLHSFPTRRSSDLPKGIPGYVAEGQCDYCERDVEAATDAFEQWEGEGNSLSGPIRIQHESGDRKSTRLNSSHLVISYAVFCLKKK